MSSLRFSALGVALFGVCAAACAGIVGADFGDVHGVNGSPFSTDGGEVIEDAAQPIQLDSAMPVIVADGGVCPQGLTDCGGYCYALGSDPNHCNDCDTHCAADPSGRGAAVCTSAHCGFACPGGYELCTTGLGCCEMATSIDAGKDTGTTQPDPGIPCANGASGFCSPLSGGYCCGVPQDSTSDECGSTANQLSCTYVFYCGSTGECPSSAPVCCYDDNPYNPNSEPNGKSSTCEASCPSNGGSQIQFCNPARTGECLTGTCSAANTFTGDHNELVTTFYTCQ